MYDLHTHILPGVDDGAPDLETALAMAKLALGRGVTHVAATPHYDSIADWSAIQEKVGQFSAALKEVDIDINLVAGAELFMDYNLVELAKEQIPTYNNNGTYCLIELPMLEIPQYSEQVLFSFKVKGITPIIAHPERYHYVLDNPNLIYEWINNGYLIQMNAGSITGMFGEKVQQVSKILLEHQMVHILASDAHSTGRRSFILDEGIRAVEKIIGLQDANSFVYQKPRMIIAGELFDVPEPVLYKKRKRFFFF